MDINELSKFFKTATEILPKGAFLTTKNDDKINTMTIGWGAFGFEWGIPVIEVMVRQSRFTKLVLEKNPEFTLSFPIDDSLKNELLYCGTHSGRDEDKISVCNLDIVHSSKISTPAVKCNGIVFECKVIAKTEMSESLSSPEIIDKWYKNGDLHTLYYAKIEACYEI